MIWTNLSKRKISLLYKVTLSQKLRFLSNNYNILFHRPLIWYEINEQDSNEIYFPSLQILGAKSLKRERRYGPNDKDFYWFKYPHLVEYQMALKVTIYCSFEFEHFPFDYHECNFDYGSASSMSTTLQLNTTRLLWFYKNLHTAKIRWNRTVIK